jgi:ABC-type glycerol-3-phosphate transport system permease component
VLSFAFLPLYLMVVVSFKTNTQFYMAPTALTFPLHTENWAEAWRLVMPTVANSVLISVSATVLPLSGPILGTVGVMQFIATWNEFVLPLIVMRDHSRLPVMVQLLRMAGEYLKFWGP